MVPSSGAEKTYFKLEKLLNAVPGLVLLFSDQGKMMWGNQRVTQFFTAEELEKMRHSIISVINPADRSLFGRQCAKVLNSGQAEATFQASFLKEKQTPFQFTVTTIHENGEQLVQLFASKALPKEVAPTKGVSLYQADYFNRLPAFLLLVNQFGEIKGISDYLLKHLQVDRSAMVGYQINSILAKDYPVDRLLKKMKILFRRGNLYNYPLTLQTVQGHLVEAVINARVESFHWSDEPLAILMLQDLTHLNQVQRELKLKEKAIEANSNPVVLISPQNRITYVNPAFLKIWGIAGAQEVLHTHFLFLFPEKEHPVLFKLMKELRMYGECRGTLSINRAETGEEALLEMTTAQILQPNGSFIGYIATFFDITQAKKDEQQIRYQADLIEQVNDAIVSVDRQFCITTWNQGAARLLRHQKGEISGKNLFKVLHFGEHEGFLRKELPKKAEWHGELTLQLPAGKSIETLTSAKKTQVHLPGQEEGYVFVFTDVSPLKHHQKELNALNEQLIKKNKSLGEFTYIVSHNLRAPIANLVGLCKLYNKHHPTDPLNNELINQIEHSAHQLDESVIDLNRILEFSRQQDHPNELASIEAIFEEAFLPLKESYDAVGATVITDFAEAPQVWCMRQYLRNILQELLVNALKFRIADEPLLVEISSRALPYSVEIKVTDNGLGIDLARHGKKIFNLYRRFHHQVPGKGIGLYLIRTQMEAHGGEIQVESTPYAGASFRLTFPTLVR